MIEGVTGSELEAALTGATLTKMNRKGKYMYAVAALCSA